MTSHGSTVIHSINDFNHKINHKTNVNKTKTKRKRKKTKRKQNQKHRKPTAGGQLWKEVKQEVDYLLKPQVLSEAAQHVRAANLSRIVLIDNLQNVIETENPSAAEIALYQNRKGECCKLFRFQFYVFSVFSFLKIKVKKCTNLI